MAMSLQEARLQKLDRVLEAQRKFLHRIPDPDTRERAEDHLHTLVDMRDAAACCCLVMREPDDKN